MFAGTNEFRELAIHYQKNGQYPYMDEYTDIFKRLNLHKKDTTKTFIYPTFDDMSYNAQQFALYWIDKFINGHKIGHVRLTGEHIFYLNTCHMDRSVNATTTNRTKVKVVERKPEFPDFWDEDFKYYVTCDIARYGIESEEYKRICTYNLDLNLVESELNFGGGLNHLWLKPRNVGASWKGAATTCHRLFLAPASQTFIFAETEQYLGGKDGFFSKFSKLRSFIQKEIWFLRKDFLNQSISDFNYRTGYKENIGGGIIESGFASQVSGVIIDGDSEKGRGKRGDAIFEEFGSFPSVEDTWIKYQASMREYGNVFGHARGFGTGGDTKTATVAGMNALNKMFSDPKTYNLLEFKNIYEESTKSCTMFTPAYINITDKDKEGNSLPDLGKTKQTVDREKWKAADDPTVYDKNCAEYPWKPSEAFALVGHNIFPVGLIREHIEYLNQTKLHETLVTNGWFEKTRTGLKFLPTEDKPYNAYPVKSGSKKSCVCILHTPYKEHGQIPDNLYRISLDPYDQEESQGNSIGSWYVIENENPFTKTKGGCIVAWWNGRPEGYNGLDTFNEQGFALAEYYNAKIGLENDRATNTIDYAKVNTDSNGKKLTLYLEEQFELAHDEKLMTKKTMKRAFGMHMTEFRKREADKYIQEWLLTPYSTDEDGKKIMNLHRIYDMGLLNELALFDGSNADRISSLRIGMYHQKEFEYKKFRQRKKQKNLAFFNKTLYA